MSPTSGAAALLLHPDRTDVVWKFMLSNSYGSKPLHLLHNGKVRFNGVDVGGLWCQGTGPLTDHLILHYHYLGDASRQKYSIYKLVDNTSSWARVDWQTSGPDLLSEVL